MLPTNCALATLFNLPYRFSLQRYQQIVPSLHYIIYPTVFPCSVANKSRLRYVIFLHLLLALLMLLRLSPSLLSLASLFVPPALTSLGLPAPWLWEYAWLASVAPALVGLLALNRNRALMLRQFALGTVALGLAPVLYGMAELGQHFFLSFFVIIIIIGLESVSASEDVIGDLPSPWATINS